jgi:hypothetical protein
MGTQDVEPHDRYDEGGIRRAYRTPRLTEFGDVSRLAEGMGSGVAEGAGGFMMTDVPPGGP